MRYIEQIVEEQLRRSEISRRFSEERLGGKPLPADKPRVITISRQIGCNGRPVAETVASRLNWSLWDRELVDAIAEHADLRTRVVEQFDEKTVSEIETFARSLFGQPEVAGFYYGRELARVVLSVARRGNAVILGRGANFLLPKALNVRLEASDEFRIANVMAAEGLDRRKAVERVHDVDRERKAFALQVFGKDIEDHHCHDITIQMDCFSIGDAADTIVSAAKAWFPELAGAANERMAASH
ncbi:MAG: cytidylate kinase-like family protein [Armatimonadota bacterium]|nr:cytidylate kinase-like family protein [Armatimonadota bacterium]